MKKKNKLFYQRYTIEKDLRHHLIEWSATLFTILGATLISMINKMGFYVLCLGNILWILFAIKHRHWGLAFVNFALFVINSIGIYRWS